MSTGQSLRGLTCRCRINVVLADGARLHLRFHRGSHLSPTSGAPRSGAKKSDTVKNTKTYWKDRARRKSVTTERMQRHQAGCRKDSERDTAKTTRDLPQRQQAECRMTLDLHPPSAPRPSPPSPPAPHPYIHPCQSISLPLARRDRSRSRKYSPRLFLK